MSDLTPRQQHYARIFVERHPWATPEHAEQLARANQGIFPFCVECGDWHEEADLHSTVEAAAPATAPNEYRDAEQRRRQMIASLGLVELDDQDRRFLEWLSGWGPETADRFMNLITKATRL